MFHKLLEAIFFCSLIDKSETCSNSCLLWLIPLLDGDRDVVSNNGSALVDKLGGVLLWLQRLAGCTVDHLDGIYFSLFQRLGCTTL